MRLVKGVLMFLWGAATTSIWWLAVSFDWGTANGDAGKWVICALVSMFPLAPVLMYVINHWNDVEVPGKDE